MNNIGYWANRMAKKNSRHYPVVRTFPIQAQGTAANTVIDQARNLSVINRRLMRMGRYYETKVDVDPNYAGAAIEVFVLRDDWAVQKGFQMAYQTYLDVSSEEREKMSPDQIARWEDFRVEHGLTLALNEARPMLANAGGVLTALTAGEFATTQVVDASGTSRTFTFGTPAAGQFGILQEYDKAGNAQPNPATLVPGNEGPYAGAKPGDDGFQYNMLESRGDNPPYDRDGVNATDPWVRVAVLGGFGGVQKLSSGFFTAPCGLILLKGYGGDPQATEVTVTAKAGDYKGVHAPSMVEVATVNRKRKVVK